MTFEVKTPSEKAEGYLEVGTNGTGQVLVNHIDMQVDEKGCGFIEFTPNQAEHLAALLLKHSRQARAERN